MSASGQQQPFNMLSLEWLLTARSGRSFGSVVACFAGNAHRDLDVIFCYRASSWLVSNNQDYIALTPTNVKRRSHLNCFV